MKDRDYDERQLAAMDAVLSKIETDVEADFDVTEYDVNSALIYAATEIDPNQTT